MGSLRRCVLRGGRNCSDGKYTEGYSTPTTQKSDLSDKDLDTTRRRSLTANHDSLAQKHLHFFEPGSERPKGKV
jgi:hypothetical protein